MLPNIHILHNANIKANNFMTVRRTPPNKECQNMCCLTVSKAVRLTSLVIYFNVFLSTRYKVNVATHLHFALIPELLRLTRSGDTKNNRKGRIGNTVVVSINLDPQCQAEEKQKKPFQSIHNCQDL